MANKKVYTIEIDGVEESIKSIDKLNNEFSELNTSTEKQAETNEQLADSFEKTKETQKESNEQNQKSIESTEALSSLMDDFGGNVLNQLRSGLSNARRGLGNLTKSLRTVKGALTGLGIGALITLLTSLGAFFTKSIDGARQFEKILASLSAGFQVLVGDLIKVGRFLSSIEIGLDGITANTELLDGAFQNVTGRIEENVTKTLELKDAQFQLRDAQRELALETAKLGAEQERLQAIADDDTISLRRQAEASERVRIQAEKRLNSEIGLSQERLNVLNKELEIAKENGQLTEELLDAQLDAQVELIEAEKELNVFRIENAARTRRINRDIFEQDLDFAIDLFDKQKTLNEQAINDEENSFEQRQAILDRTVQLSTEAFEEQQRLAEDFTGKKLELNELVAIDDQKQVVERLKQADIDEISTNRILEILKERKQVEQDLLLLQEEITNDKIEFAKREKKADEDLQTFRLERDARLEKNAELQLQKQIAIIERKKDLELENDELLASEKILIEEKALDEIAKLRDEFREKEKEKDEEANELRKENLKQIAQAGEELLRASIDFLNSVFDENIARQEERLLESQERVDLAEERLNESRQRAEELNNEIKESTGARREFLIDQIETEKKAEKELEKEKKKAQQNELKRQKELENARKKQAAFNKAVSITEAIINGALAITRVFAAINPPASFVLAGLTAATTALQVATISNQKFQDGGILKGKSHAEGGIPIAVRGGGVVEAEGEEAIINKNSTRMFKPILSAINVAGGGKKFAEGGIIGANFGQATVDLQQGNLVNEIRALRNDTVQLANRPVYTVATEVADVNSRVSTIRENATI